MYKYELDQARDTLAQLEVEQNTIRLSGEWSWVTVDEKLLNVIPELSTDKIIIDGLAITYLDTTGAFFLQKIVNQLQQQGSSVEILLLEADQPLLQMTAGIELSKTNPLNHQQNISGVAALGALFVHLWHTTLDLLTFFGQITLTLCTLFKRGHALYTQGILETISSAGIKGIAISSLLCFLIGVNLTYQMSPQFVTYGANVYIVNFLGIALLREVTPLLTAVIVAGRTGSSITASIGTMQVQEEIDALQTMGISAMRRLVIPRIIGLIIALPILTMLADVASMFGGMLIAATTLNISYSLFIHRLQTYVSINNYTIGIVKTLVFAWIIGMVGCYCGFRVKGNADSIGVQTTRSVVMSICLIIVADAIFAIMFKSLGM